MLLFMEGFENLHMPNGSVQAGGGFSYPTGRSGVGNAFMTTGNNINQAGSLSLPTSGLASGYFGVGFRGGTGVCDTNNLFIQVRETTTVHLALRFNAAGQIELTRGAGTTVLGTSVATPSRTAWNHYAVDYVIHDSAGSAIVYINGIEVINVSGVDTRNAGTSGVVNNVWVNSTVQGGGTIEIDDWYHGDTTGSAPFNASLGDCVVETLRPTGQGTHNDWVGSDANSIDNWNLIDDVSTTTDYIASGTPGARDTSTMSDLPAPAVSVLAVQTEAYVTKSDAGAVSDLLEVFRDSGGTVMTGELADASALTAGYQWFRGVVRTVDPDGVPWTISTVNSMEVGVEVA